jgi:hypothetical protein
VFGWHSSHLVTIVGGSAHVAQANAQIDYLPAGNQDQGLLVDDVASPEPPHARRDQCHGHGTHRLPQ